MAKKSSVQYVCQNCGSAYPKWQGKCDSCGEWNTIIEEQVGGEGFSRLAEAARLTDIKTEMIGKDFCISGYIVKE